LLITTVNPQCRAFAGADLQVVAIHAIRKYQLDKEKPMTSAVTGFEIDEPYFAYPHCVEVLSSAGSPSPESRSLRPFGRFI
jgi:hypothetical protein